MNTITYYLAGIRGLFKQRHSQKSKPLDFVAEELIRNTHSVEKGLCIRDPRLGFGHQKQDAMLRQIRQLKDSDDALHRSAVSMALDAIREYLDFHEEKGYSDDFITRMKDEVMALGISAGGEKHGGTVLFRKSELDGIDAAAVERFIGCRHSIRDFSDEDIDDSVLKKALLLAEKAPSACNRQGVRAYVICREKLKDLAAKLPEIGGFAEAAKRIIVITGKINAYRPEEINQYIVSASMYAAYLTLTLPLYGIGVCVVQRPVIWMRSWEMLRRTWKISEDEQIVCMLTIGMLRDECRVPLSYRLGDEIVAYIR